MIARAPGKVLLSGAYAVLEGAPAIVAAIDRYVTADASRTAEDHVAAEVQAAIAQGTLRHAPWFDAAPLRAPLPDGESRKLGLGSSAAILVASLAAAAPRDEGRDAIFAAAFAAHRAAQPRGSGVDVAASTFGGVLRAARRSSADHALEIAPHALPAGLFIEVFACPISASTPALLERIEALRRRNPACYRRLLDEIAEGARRAVTATSTASLLPAITAQIDALVALGAASAAPIVTLEVGVLRCAAAEEDAEFGPSGAGGGDIAVFFGGAPSSARFRALAAELSMTRLDLLVGAEGVHQVAR